MKIEKQHSPYETIAALVTLSIVIYLIFDLKNILYIGLSLGLMTLFIRPLAIFVHKGWSYLAKWLNYITSRVLLSIVFFLVLTPIAIIYRLMGKDSLKKKEIGQESYFTERNHQFTAEDFKKTW
ncbi:MAG: SxtJ family membrane protein [Saprospiraceae bacterium]